MGWESAVSLGFSGLKGVEQVRQGQAQSDALAQTAENKASNIADNTVRSIGTLQTSFLKGGIALDDVGGTTAVLQQAANKGNVDISRTIDNANASISNTMNAARTGALDTIAGGISKLGSGNISKFLDNAYSGSSLQSAWNGLTGDTDPSPLGDGTGTLY